MSSKPYYVEQRVTPATLPDVETQRRLIDLYFAHVHPVLPIVDRAQFLESWDAYVRSVGSFRRLHDKLPLIPRLYRYPDHLESTASEAVYPELKHVERLSLTLLLAIFAVASRHLDDDVGDLPPGKLWTAGLEYASEVRHILSTYIHFSVVPGWPAD